jgi:hypothetical protein
MTDIWLWAVDRFGKPIAAFFAFAIVWLVLFVLLQLAQCVGDRKASDQAEQSNRSAEAYGKAVDHAIDTVANRADAENAIEAATAIVKKEIGNAASTHDIDVLITSRVCDFPEYRGDAACQLPRSDP